MSPLTLRLSPGSVLGLYLSRVLGMAGNKGRARPHTCCSFFTCTQRFFCFPEFFWQILLSFELLLACLSLLECDAQIWVCCFKEQPEEHREEQNNYLAGMQQPGAIDFCSIDHPPAHSLLDGCLARYLHTASLLLFIPSYVLIFCICPAESLCIDCRPLL